MLTRRSGGVMKLCVSRIVKHDHGRGSGAIPLGMNTDLVRRLSIINSREVIRQNLSQIGAKSSAVVVLEKAVTSTRKEFP